MTHVRLTGNAAHFIPNWFPVGAGAESGLKTRAKPEIWSDNATFLATANGLEIQAAKLEAVADGGDLMAVSGRRARTGLRHEP